MERTVKGIFLKNILKIIEERKGPEGLKKLEEKFGNLDFSAVKNYPTEEEVRLTKTAIEVLYGQDSPETQLEFGRLAFKVFEESLVGKTMFPLLGKDAKKAAFGAQRAVDTITSGYKIKVEDLGPNKLRITVGNDPHHIRHFEGVLLEAAKHFGYQAKIRSSPVGPEEYEYEIEWENKKEEG